MMVMTFEDFKAHGSCPRSDVAKAKGMLIPFNDKEHTSIFVSHNWWQTAAMGQRKKSVVGGDGASPSARIAFDTGAPDWTDGENAHLKFRTLCLGVEQPTQIIHLCAFAAHPHERACLDVIS